ncbi:hypothetical protein LPJ73_001533 [Coemansia sp. RSA 2703]|nr:hypothetical protein LPJ73_001533 [Coemansia sp. RSA 2703]KAJ2366609.1 hypothetical protein IW150_005897 [Coemansia sp. RSA 2607]KAJ2391853.1 hypothetical protein GGI05_002831 [Coemansia sp. RSA 2603]
MSPGVTVAKPVMKVRKSGKYDVDAQLAKQSKADKVMLRRRIEFRLATQPDAKMDMLRKKYKPINDIDSRSNKDNSKSSTNGSNKHKAVESNGVIDSNGLVESSGFRRAAHSLFPTERLSDSWVHMHSIGPGLNNLGNTCFLNSVLQCLTHTPVLAEYMLTRKHSASCRAGDNCMLCRFEAHVVRALSKRESSSISPKSIVGRLKLVAKHMRIGRQEDSHEFLRLLVEAFQRSLLYGIDPKIDRRIQETTLVHQVFGGYLQSQVKCERCGYESNTFEPLLDLSLDIHSGGSSISKALRGFTRPEMLTKSNRYKCDKCTKLVDATKQMTIYRLPRILTLQLKRFSTFGGGKINRYIEFPLNLNMKNYVSKTTSETGPYDYSLYAVLVHAGGTARSGHYYCYAKSPAGVWHELNDSMVHRVSVDTVLKQSAYMLFYERIGSSLPKKDSPQKAARTQSSEEHVTKAKQERSVESRSEDFGQAVDTSAVPVPPVADDLETLLNGSSVDKKRKKKNKKKNRQGTLITSASGDDVSMDKTKANSKNNESTTINGLKDVAKEIDSLMLTSPTSIDINESTKQADAVIEKITADLEDCCSTSSWNVQTKDTKTKASDLSKVIDWNEGMASKQAKIAALVGKKPASDLDPISMRPDRSSQYGAKIESWAGDSSSADRKMGREKTAEERKAAKRRNRRPDEYDAAYDAGRQKKVKKAKLNKFATIVNPFQTAGERFSKKNKRSG